MKPHNIVVIDTETGGLDADEHSILSIGAALLENGEVTDSKEWFVDEGDYMKATDEALNINGLNLEEVRAKGKSPTITIGKLLHFIPNSFKSRGKYLLAGHNIGFDVKFLNRLGRLAENPGFVNDSFSYRMIDTCAILQFLYLRGELRKPLGKLGTACEHYGIPLVDAHTAEADAVATAKLLAKLLEPLKTQKALF